MAGGKKGKGGQGGGKKPEQNEGQFKFNFDSEGQQLVPKEAKTTTLDLANNQAFVNLIQQRMGSLIGKSSGYFESLPPKVQERVKALKNLHSQKVELDKAFKKEFKALQDKYEAMFAPLYVRRSELVQGKSEPKPEELVEAKKEEKDEKAEAKEEKKEEKSEEQGGKAEEKDVKGIPDFWLEALKHNDDFGEMITKKDEQVLKHLIDVRWKPAEGHPDPSFVVEFEFEENEWFTNKVVSKTYILSENESIGETMFDNVESTPINWKPGKNITVKLVQQQIGRGGRRGKGRGGKPQTKMVEQKQHSFFNFFDKEGLIPANEDMDEDDDYNEADLLEFDYELGLALKEQIIPSAVVWFTGEANQGYGMEGEEFGEDFDDESGEDEEFEPPKQLPGAPGEQKPECAQQ